MSIGILAALAQDWLGFWTAMIALGTTLGAMLVATIPFKRRMSELRDADAAPAATECRD